MKDSIIDSKELLMYLLEKYNIDLGSEEEKMINTKKEKIVYKFHPYKIFQGTDGRWKTTIPDETKKDGRRIVARKNKEDLIDFLYEIYGDAEEQEQEELRKQKNRQITLESIYPEWLEFKSIHSDAETYITRLKSDWNKFYMDTLIIKIPLCQLTRLMLDE